MGQEGQVAEFVAALGASGCQPLIVRVGSLDLKVVVGVQDGQSFEVDLPAGR